MLKKYPLLAAALVASASAYAQASRPAEIFQSDKGQTDLVRFSPADAPALGEAPYLLRTILGLPAQTVLRSLRTDTDAMGYRHERYQQYYQGIPVERATYVVHSRAGQIEWLSGALKPLADNSLSIRPSLTAAQALRSALAFVHASKYMWQEPGQEVHAQEAEGKATFYPSGELVVIENALSMDRTKAGQPTLAWKFNIYATQPVSRAWVYVDAHSGEVVNQDAIIKHTAATATFATAYSGTRSIANDQVSSTSYRLRETTRGLGIETYNMKKGTSYTAAIDFTDADNNWTSAEYNNTNKDWVAGDAHFGAQCTYDYWSAVHGRNSYNNAGAKIKSYVHFSSAYDNAYWDGSVMTYGDGGSYFRPLTSMDVCGHEIGHAVCEYTANLAYENESGAMNEGFSDIWGACIEARAVSTYGLTGKSTWLIGEEISLPSFGAALRSMSNPNQFQQPDTYQGTYWAATTSNPTDANDYGGVHTNSGVLNYWFYLLSQGGSGTNDKGNAFSVTGATMAKAEKIAFLTETSLSASSTFAAARTAAINAATTLYGAGSAEVIATTNAWYAVGVGAAYSGGTSCGTPTSVTAGSLTSSGATISWATVSGASSYSIQYKLSSASTWTTTTSTTNSKALTGLSASTAYNVQVAAVCSGTTGAYSTAISFTTSTASSGGYCTANGTNVSYEYIDKVAMSTLSRTSGADGGYYDGTALSTSAAQGSSQTITLSAGYASSTYIEYFNVWVDFNKNGVFTDAGEQVVTNLSNAGSAGDITATFTVPSGATVGSTRMRVSMRDASGQASCGSYTYGEVEDYTVNITAGGSTCNAPTGLTVGSITSAGGTASWTAATGATSYSVQYKLSSASTWTTVSSTTTAYALTGLAASSTYNVQVATVCSSGTSAYSTAVSFTTSAISAPAYCTSKGTSVSYEYIDKVAIGSISRTSGADAGYYNGSASSTSVAAGSSQTITVSAGFTGSAYSEYFKIYADWNNDGDFADANETLASLAASSVATDRTATFTVPSGTTNGGHRLRVVMSDASATTSCGTYSYGETEDYTLNVTGGTVRALAGSKAAAGTGAEVYPNPATTALRLSLPDGATAASATVYDLRGAEMNVRFDGRETLDVTNLPAGMYSVVISDGTTQYRVRFAKN